MGWFLVVLDSVLVAIALLMLNVITKDVYSMELILILVVFVFIRLFRGHL